MSNGRPVTVSPRLSENKINPKLTQLCNPRGIQGSTSPSPSPSRDDAGFQRSRAETLRRKVTEIDRLIERRDRGESLKVHEDLKIERKPTLVRQLSIIEAGLASGAQPEQDPPRSPQWVGNSAVAHTKRRTMPKQPSMAAVTWGVGEADQCWCKTIDGHSGAVTCCCVFVDGDASGSNFLFTGSADCTIRRWRLADLEPDKAGKAPSRLELAATVLIGHSSAVQGLDVVPVGGLDGGPCLLSAALDCSIIRWDPGTGKKISEHYGFSPILCLARLFGGAVAGTRDGKLQVWEGRRDWKPADFTVADSEITAVASRPNTGVAVAGTAVGELSIWRFQPPGDSAGSSAPLEAPTLFASLLDPSMECVRSLGIWSSGAVIYGGYGANMRTWSGQPAPAKLPNHGSDKAPGPIEAIAIEPGLLLSSFYDVHAGTSHVAIRAGDDARYVLSIGVPSAARGAGTDQARIRCLCGTPGGAVVAGDALGSLIVWTIGKRPPGAELGVIDRFPGIYVVVDTDDDDGSDGGDELQRSRGRGGILRRTNSSGRSRPSLSTALDGMNKQRGLRRRAAGSMLPFPTTPMDRAGGAELDEHEIQPQVRPNGLVELDSALLGSPMAQAIAAIVGAAFAGAMAVLVGLRPDLFNMFAVYFARLWHTLSVEDSALYRAWQLTSHSLADIFQLLSRQLADLWAYLASD